MMTDVMMVSENLDNNFDVDNDDAIMIMNKLMTLYELVRIREPKRWFCDDFGQQHGGHDDFGFDKELIIFVMVSTITMILVNEMVAKAQMMMTLMLIAFMMTSMTST